MNKYLFLSIQGVLCTSQDWCRLRNYGRPCLDKYGNVFNEMAVHNLKKIVEETDAKIVITDFERIYGLDWLRNKWAYRHMPCEIYDCLPHPNFMELTTIGNKDISEGEKWKWDLGVTVDRGAIAMTIEAWLYRNVYQKNRRKDRYAILDYDDKQFLVKQQRHMVVVDMREGLTKKDYLQTVKLLNDA